MLFEICRGEFVLEVIFRWEFYRSKEKCDGEKCANRNRTSSDKLRKGVMLCLHTCNVSEDGNDAHYGSGNEKSEIKKKEYRSCRSASVGTYLYVK